MYYKKKLKGKKHYAKLSKRREIASLKVVDVLISQSIYPYLTNEGKNRYANIFRLSWFE